MNFGYSKILYNLHLTEIESPGLEITIVVIVVCLIEKYLIIKKIHHQEGNQQHTLFNIDLLTTVLIQ